MSSLARSALILYDSELRVTELNAAARALPGAESWTGRLLPECLASLFPAGAPAPERQQLREYAKSGSAFPVRIGDSIWRAELSPLSDSAEPQSSLNGLPVDGSVRSGATAGQRASGALILREAGKAEDYRDFALDRVDFVAALSHDLRTPLNAMLGWLHLLAMPRRGPELSARAVEGLQHAVEQQKLLLEDWLERAHSAHPDQEPPARKPRRPRFVRTRPDTPATQLRPALWASSNAARAAAADGAGSDLTGVFVLAVDDRPEMLDVLTQVLAAEGASIETTTSADDALARYPAWATSGGERLLVSDLAMPGRDGFSLIREIRALERCRQMPRLPAVALSAHGLPDVRRRAIENGFDLFVDKPVDPRVLLGRLHSLLDR